MKSPTFRLFKQLPSFAGGFSAAVSFDAPVTDNFNTDEDETTADLKALYSDWRAVGNDLRTALNQYDRGASN